jgi:hypothetical protein
MPKTSKLTEYEAFKKSLRELERPEVNFVEFGDYVVTSKKKMEETAKGYRNAVLLQQQIYGKIN